MLSIYKNKRLIQIKISGLHIILYNLPVKATLEKYVEINDWRPQQFINIVKSNIENKKKIFILIKDDILLDKSIREFVCLLLFTTKIPYVKLTGSFKEKLNFSYYVKNLKVNGMFNFDLCKIEKLIIMYEVFNIENIIADNILFFKVKSNEILEIKNEPNIYFYKSDIKINKESNKLNSINEYLKIKDIEFSENETTSED